MSKLSPTESVTVNKRSEVSFFNSFSYPNLIFRDNYYSTIWRLISFNIVNSVDLCHITLLWWFEQSNQHCTSHNVMSLGVKVVSSVKWEGTYWRNILFLGTEWWIELNLLIFTDNNIQHESFFPLNIQPLNIHTSLNAHHLNFILQFAMLPGNHKQWTVIRATLQCKNLMVNCQLWYQCLHCFQPHNVYRSDSLNCGVN